jgi:hypothetical protein
MRFPKASPSSQVVPQDIPNSTSVLLPCIQTRKAGHRRAHLFLCCNLGCLMFQKNWWWANYYGPFSTPPPNPRPKKKQHEHTHELINMNPASYVTMLCSRH